MPLAAAGGTEIPHTLSSYEVVDHLRKTPGFGQYLEMLETHDLASRAMVDDVIHHKFNLLGMSGKRVTTEALRGDVRDHFRERVTERLCDLSSTFIQFHDLAITDYHPVPSPPTWVRLLDGRSGAASPVQR